MSLLTAKLICVGVCPVLSVRHFFCFVLVYFRHIVMVYVKYVRVCVSSIGIAKYLDTVFIDILEN